jgi:hypothetical protein
MAKRKPNEPEVIDIPFNNDAPAERVTSLARITGGDLARIEIDKQIATAKEYPRSLELVQRNAMALVDAHLEMTKDPKDGLYYSMKRGGKDIEGPNVRIAEIIQHTYGNSRAGAQPTGSDDKYVFAQGVFHDLESNTAISMTVKRRIVDRDGNRYNDDMIGVTENAACAIAYRNAVLKGIPKAIWWKLYLRARKVSGGVTKTDTAARLKLALNTCKKFGVPEANLCERLGVKKVDDIGSNELATLVGILTAVKSHATTLEREFNLKKERTTSDVKSTAPNPEGAITRNQILDIMTLLDDYGLKDMDVRRALDAIGHKDVLPKLPQSKLAAFHKELEKRKK